MSFVFYTWVFLNFFLYTDLLDLFLIYHFNCLIVSFFPMEVWLFLIVGTLCQRRLIIANLSAICLVMLFALFYNDYSTFVNALYIVQKMIV